jgi:hypothetical protein
VGFAEVEYVAGFGLIHGRRRDGGWVRPPRPAEIQTLNPDRSRPLRYLALVNPHRDCVLESAAPRKVVSTRDRHATFAPIPLRLDTPVPSSHRFARAGYFYPFDIFLL